jgi:hypothetical protein
MHTEAGNHDAIYDKLVTILRFKFKTPLKGTDITFKNLYKMLNLVSNVEDYLVVIEGQKSICFSDGPGFIQQLILIVKGQVDELNNEYKELQLRQQNDVLIDEYEIFNRHEYIGYTGERLLKLLAFLREQLKKES